jgi:hypothetical protein
MNEMIRYMIINSTEMADPILSSGSSSLSDTRDLLAIEGVLILVNS